MLLIFKKERRFFFLGGGSGGRTLNFEKFFIGSCFSVLDFVDVFVYLASCTCVLYNFVIKSTCISWFLMIINPDISMVLEN